jgi:hypothetical protein
VVRYNTRQQLVVSTTILPSVPSLASITDTQHPTEWQDEGYVDPEASLGNTLKRLFGMSTKSSKPTELPPGPGSQGRSGSSGNGASKKK